MAVHIFYMLPPLLFIILLPEQAMPATLTIANSCSFPVWPGLLSGAGTLQLGTTGFLLNPGESCVIEAPLSWSGRLWGRTLCSTDPTTGRFACGSADCGSGAIECSGSGASPPATLAEFTLDGSEGMDFYDVSLVDGYNLPMLVVPLGGGGGSRCGSTGCLVDVNRLCPTELMVVAGSEAVACRSACEAFGSPQYCCSGEFGEPNTCKPSAYSQLFKNACPRAYSYAYDDATSTFTCSAGGGYLITFCPNTTRNSLKTWGSDLGSTNNPQAAGLPLINETMVFLRGGQSCSRPKGRRLGLVVLALMSSAAWWLL